MTPDAGPSAGDPNEPASFVPARLVLGRYRLHELLGSGGSADVWLAEDERLGRMVALKLLHPHLLPDAASRERFAAEARAVASVSHPGIVGVHDVVIEGRTAAIVFEYVRGESLEAYLRRQGRLQPVQAAEIAAQLAEALAAAHAAGLVHRDVKPGNVLLDGAGRARLVDFGIAQALGEAKARLTGQGQVIGTLRSMAPEQLAGLPGSPASDIYALGTVLYEMLAGRPAYPATTPVALVEQQRRPPAPIPDAPAGLAALVIHCLQPDPAARPASATEIAGYLRGWLAGATPAASPSSVRMPATPPLPAVAAAGGAPARGVARAPVQSGALTLGAPPKRRDLGTPLLWTLSFGLVIAVGMLGGWWLAAGGLGGSPRPTPSTIAVATPRVTPMPRPTPSPSPTPTPTPVPTPTPTPTPSPTPTASPSPTPTAQPSLVILSPEDGATVSERKIDISGIAPPNVTITWDVAVWPDNHTQSDDNGDWRFRNVTLHPGRNDFTFRIGDDRSTEQHLTVNYEP